tara:strand:- start:388 stop:987 length:600 start_codon:yes stop_codon:yes gene_type:complete
MGGFNSGGGRGALRTGYFLDLDLASLKRLNMLRPGYSGSLHWSRGDETIGTIGVWVRQDSIRLSYRSRPYGGEWETIEDTIPLVETEAGFGGRRKWFLCPSCRRRARILYGGRLYRCRVCRGATYESQYEPLFHASHERIRRLKKRLGDRQADTWSGLPDRPKGMHHATYERLCDEIWNEEMKMDRALGAYARMKGFEV